MSEVKRYVRFEDVDAAYDVLIGAVGDAYDTEEKLKDIEAKVAAFWEELRLDPDFKPGRSNAERDAKLRMNNPALMNEYDNAVIQVSEAKVEVEVARLHVEKLKTFIKLATVLTSED